MDQLDLFDFSPAIAQRPKILQSAMGITTGDKITTDYESGPYRVETIGKPTQWQWTHHGHFVTDWFEISLGLSRWDNPNQNGYTINHIRREGNRYFSAFNEISVEPMDSSSLIGPIEIRSAEPFQPQHGVNYEAGWRRTWKCRKCFAHFNDDRFFDSFPCMYRPHCESRSDAEPLQLLHTPAVAGYYHLPDLLDWTLRNRWEGKPDPPACLRDDLVGPTKALIETLITPWGLEIKPGA